MPSAGFPNLGNGGRAGFAAGWAVAAAAWAGVAAAGAPVGLAALGDLDALPLLRENTRIIQFSSFDRTGDGDEANDDRNAWLRRDAAGEYVLYEDDGPGCVYRIWMTCSQSDFITNNRLRIYFDGEAAPRVDRNVGEFFSGTNAPFLRPLVGDKTASAGGMYCYLPFPYARGCRITTTWFPPESERYQHWPADWGYYQITGHRFDSTNGLATWTGAEDAATVLHAWTHCGEDLRPAAAGDLATGSVTVAAGSTATVFSASQPGCVTALRVDPEPHDIATLASARLLARWDGGPDAVVDAPLGEFFGTAFGETTALALMTGLRTDGWYYCHFPMPFWSGAEIAIANTGTQGPVRVDFEIAWRTNTYDPARCGFFHARHSRWDAPGDGRDFALLEAAGRGHIAGLHLSVTSAVASLAFLEMDDRLFVDGARSPAVHGTGVEDYFNSGWYYLGATNLCLPLHGLFAARLGGSPGNFISACRHQIADVYPFGNSARFLMETAPAFVTSSRWSAVVFYYAQAATGLVRCVAVDVGDASSEAAAGWTATGAAEPDTHTWRYPGDPSSGDVTDDGRSITGAVQFTVPLPFPNAGVLLRRRMDAGVAGQRAAVHADGRFAGTWHWPDAGYGDSSNRWCDAEFMIPRALTAGRTTLVVRVERDATGAAPWTDYREEVLAFVPLDHADDTDLDGLPDAWEVRHFDWIDSGDAGGDPDGDGQPNGAEWIAGTDPSDRLSVFTVAAFSAAGPALAFDGVSNRVYRIQRASSLSAADWADTAGIVTGAGERVSLPIEPAGGSSFFRVRAAPRE